MDKPKYNKEAYLQMLQQKLGGAVTAKGNGQSSIIEQLRRTMPIRKTNGGFNK